MNLLCGVLGVIFTLKARTDIAFPLMIAASVFDFLDGFTARLLKVYSEMGKELDSLSDLVSFGILPSLLLYETMVSKTEHETFLCYIPLLIAVFSALRLAKFNIDTRQSFNFIGLATPASAMICGSLAYFVNAEPESFLAEWSGGVIFIPVLSVILATLMVSEIPMFSMKIKKDSSDYLTKMKRTAFFSVAAICMVIVAVLGQNWSLAVLLIFSCYVIMNLLFLFLKTPSKGIPSQQ